MKKKGGSKGNGNHFLFVEIIEYSPAASLEAIKSKPPSQNDHNKPLLQKRAR